jgi:hypothetical protein
VSDLKNICKFLPRKRKVKEQREKQQLLIIIYVLLQVVCESLVAYALICHLYKVFLAFWTLATNGKLPTYVTVKGISTVGGDCHFTACSW